MQAAGVVGVQMRHHHLADVTGLDPELLELRADLLLRLDEFTNRETEDRMPTREIARLRSAGAFARVDHDHALGMLDREGVDRKRLSPAAVENRVHEAAPAMTDALAPGGRDRHGSLSGLHESSS